MAQRPEPSQRMSLDEYLAWEEETPIRYEYVAGEVHAMTGTTTRHNLITLNIVRALHGATRARRCRVFAAMVKLRAAVDRMYYPDLIVACGKAAEVEFIVEQPSLVVEVTSPSSRATDRREKLEAYLQLASLRTYLIVAQRLRHVIAYTRSASGEWIRDEFRGEGEIAIPFLETQLTLDEIYDDVPLPPPRVKEGEEFNEDWVEAEV